MLRVVQGHPKLLELADAAAADRDRLDAFFRDGHTGLEAARFLDALACWTTGALDALSPAARLMAEFVACLEDEDRASFVIDANWADLWRRLARPGDAPAPGPLLDALATAALVEAAFVEAWLVVVSGGDGRPGTADAAGVSVAYRVHPGVAAAITAQADPAVREAVDAGLAAFWQAVSRQAREREGGEDSGLVVQAGLAAAPYLLRRGDPASRPGVAAAGAGADRGACPGAGRDRDTAHRDGRTPRQR